MHSAEVPTAKDLSLYIILFSLWNLQATIYGPKDYDS
jgi:hypothetical protein